MPNQCILLLFFCQAYIICSTSMIIHKCLKKRDPFEGNHKPPTYEYDIYHFVKELVSTLLVFLQSPILSSPLQHFTNQQIGHATRYIPIQHSRVFSFHKTQQSWIPKTPPNG
ncbi:hypothetical protein ACJW31_06G030400 [Castanea mollissima]